MKIKETVIPWREYSGQDYLIGGEYLSIDSQGIISANMVKPNTIAYAYRSDLKHYPNDPKDVSKPTV